MVLTSADRCQQFPSWCPPRLKILSTLAVVIIGSPLHRGLEQTRIETELLGHSLVRSLVRSHHSLVRLLQTACFARALRCAHSFAHSLARGKVNFWCLNMTWFCPIVRRFHETKRTHSFFSGRYLLTLFRSWTSFQSLWDGIENRHEDEKRVRVIL